MAALDLYLGIEKLRFAERLRLEFDVEDAALPALVPSLRQSSVPLPPLAEVTVTELFFVPGEVPLTATTIAQEPGVCPTCG